MSIFKKESDLQICVLLNFVFIFEIMADFYHFHVKSKLICPLQEHQQVNRILTAGETAQFQQVTQ